MPMLQGCCVRAWDEDKTAVDGLCEKIDYEKETLVDDGLMMGTEFLV